MSVQVPVEGTLECEALVTFRAPVRPFVGVHSPMFDQGALRRKSRIALITGERLFVTVHSLVNQ